MAKVSSLSILYVILTLICHKWSSSFCRTLYVILAVGLCAVIGGLLLFFLFPRSVKMSSNLANLKPDHMYINVTQELVSMTITVSAIYNNFLKRINWWSHHIVMFFFLLRFGTRNKTLASSIVFDITRLLSPGCPHISLLLTITSILLLT